jgi:signal transduction histidine kinase
MVGTRRRKSIAFIVLGAGLVLVILLLYIGWVLLNWRTGILLFLGILLLALIIAGIVVNTIFLVREIRRNEQHDAFINAVTHELKTPVASIRLYVETLQTRSVDESRRNEFYRIMLADSDRLLGTIEQILRTGRLGSNRKVHRVPVNLQELVTECVGRSRILHNISQESLRYEPGPPLPILGDYDEIRSAVSNLIDNAVKYSGNEVRVDVAASRDEPGGYATIRVQDQGAGIPHTEMNRIFKRFYRISGPVATRVKGTGLGLFIVRSVAKRHGGRVWAESAGPGHGSTFILQLPIAT